MRREQMRLTEQIKLDAISLPVLLAPSYHGSVLLFRWKERVVVFFFYPAQTASKMPLLFIFYSKSYSTIARLLALLALLT